jgi:hypothetical protein
MVHLAVIALGIGENVVHVALGKLAQIKPVNPQMLVRRSNNGQLASRKAWARQPPRRGLCEDPFSLHTPFKLARGCLAKIDSSISGRMDPQWANE